MENLDKNKPIVEKEPVVQNNDKNKRPNDFGSVQIDAHFKIYDPNTQQVYVEGRA